MAHPYDYYDGDYDGDDFDGSYSYGLTEKQIRERMYYAIHGDELEDEYELDFGDLDDDEQPDDDD